MIETLVWASVATLGIVLAFVRSKQWSSSSARELEAVAAEQKKIRDDCTKNFKAIGDRLNDLTSDMVNVKPYLLNIEELLRQFEEIKATVSSMKTKAALKAVGTRE